MLGFVNPGFMTDLIIWTQLDVGSTTVLNEDFK